MIFYHTNRPLSLKRFIHRIVYGMIQLCEVKDVGRWWLSTIYVMAANLYSFLRFNRANYCRMKAPLIEKAA